MSARMRVGRGKGRERREGATDFDNGWTSYDSNGLDRHALGRHLVLLGLAQSKPSGPAQACRARWRHSACTDAPACNVSVLSKEN